jgi:hypothetical protein
MPTYQEGNIECPFYMMQDKNSIFCESSIKEVRRNNLTFRNANLKKEYIDKYCVVNGGRGCIHYKIMSYLYDTGVLK